MKIREIMLYINNYKRKEIADIKKNTNSICWNLAIAISFGTTKYPEYFAWFLSVIFDKYRDNISNQSTSLFTSFQLNKSSTTHTYTLFNSTRAQLKHIHFSTQQALNNSNIYTFQLNKSSTKTYTLFNSTRAQLKHIHFSTQQELN